MPPSHWTPHETTSESQAKNYTHNISFVTRFVVSDRWLGPSSVQDIGFFLYYLVTSSYILDKRCVQWPLKVYILMHLVEGIYF
jgi:hypothetical protein